MRAALARFRRAREGATALEFALVAAPFLFMIFSIIELALVFVMSTTLENAVADAGRRIRTGELQTNGQANAAAFRQQICDGMGWLEDSCPNRLSVDVRAFTTFASASAPDPTADGIIEPDELSFEAGKAESVVLVRAWYRWPLVTPFLSKALSKLDTGEALVVSATTFRNEPYVED